MSQYNTPTKGLDSLYEVLILNFIVVNIPKKKYNTPLNSHYWLDSFLKPKLGPTFLINGETLYITYFVKFFYKKIHSCLYIN